MFRSSLSDATGGTRRSGWAEVEGSMIGKSGPLGMSRHKELPAVKQERDILIGGIHRPDPLSQASQPSRDDPRWNRKSLAMRPSLDSPSGSIACSKAT